MGKELRDISVKVRQVTNDWIPQPKGQTLGLEGKKGMNADQHAKLVHRFITDHVSVG